MIRVVESTNPDWYRALCAGHTKRRRNRRKRLGKKHHDTKIVRPRIESVLRNWLRRGWSTSIYAEELLELAAEVKTELDDLEASYAAVYEEAPVEDEGFFVEQSWDDYGEAPF